MSKKKDMPESLADAFTALDKINEDSTLLSENCLSIVKEFIDTGSMALNVVLSGSLYGGIPKGRITGLVGPTGSGKSLILSKIIANAQKKDPDTWGVVWDTENAFDPQMANSVGANINKIKVCPVGTIEDCRNQIFTFLDKVEKDPSLYGKIIIGIDSLGNLASAKELLDAENGKDAVDMGLRAKVFKSLFRVLVHKCAKTNTTIVYTNHIYADPMAMYTSLIKHQSGGKGPEYNASVVIQLAVTQEKIEDDDIEEYSPLANKVKGVNLRALIVKNRGILPFMETTMYLNFRTGLYKYSGLIEMAEAYKVINRQGNTYYNINGEKLGFRKAFKNDDDIWETKILPLLEPIVNEKLQYSSSVKELEKEVEQKEKILSSETE